MEINVPMSRTETAMCSLNLFCFGEDDAFVSDMCYLISAVWQEDVVRTLYHTIVVTHF